MAAILADNIFKCIFLNKNVKISIKIWLKFVPKGPIDNKSALVQVMAWRRTSAKPLPEAMMTQFTDAYPKCHSWSRKTPYTAMRFNPGLHYINCCRATAFLPTYDMLIN